MRRCMMFALVVGTCLIVPGCCSTCVLSSMGLLGATIAALGAALGGGVGVAG